jgi:hypothetical protein
VGTESPTFIEPVQKRKDGIEAMFMRQSKAPKSEPHSPSSSIYEEGQEETRALPGGNDDGGIAGCRHVAVRETLQS